MGMTSQVGNLGALVEIPDDIDVSDDSKRYAEFYFKENFEWLKHLSMRWANKHPQATWEDCLRVSWERLPLILSKFNRAGQFDIRLFVRSQLGFYWFTATYRPVKKDAEQWRKIAALKEHSRDLEHGQTFDGFEAIDLADHLELYDVHHATQFIEDERIRNVILAIVVLNVTYRELSAFTGLSLGTIANMAEEGFTIIYKADYDYYESLRKAMPRGITKRVNHSKTSTVAQQEDTDGDSKAAMRDELQQRIAEYWQNSMANRQE